MSDRTTTTATVSTPNVGPVCLKCGKPTGCIHQGQRMCLDCTPTVATAPSNTSSNSAPFQPTMEQLGDMAARLARLKGLGYAELTADLRKGLAWDAAYCVLDQGLEWAEFAEGLEEWLAGGNTVAEYLAESSFPGPTGNVLYLATEHSHAEALAAWRALAGNAADTTVAEEDAPVDPAAAKVAQDAQAAADKAAEQEQVARKDAHTTLQALVKAYAKGERAYREGLLESGRLAALYTGRRLALGDKRAAAVQAIEGQLAAVATDVVDVNRLIRCWAAWDLLAVGDLVKLAKDVPYGHYRDAWSLVLVRQDADKPTERFVLLPGLEADCQAAFKQAVADTLSKAACIERAHGLVRQHATKQAAAEKAAREQADLVAKQASEKAEQERKARQAADEQARQAEQTAKQAAQAEQTATDEQAKQAAAEKAEQAKREADKAKAEAAAKRFAEEQAARQAATAKQDQVLATKREAEAETAKAKLDQKAQQAAAKASGTKPATKPDQTPRTPSPVATGQAVIDPAAWADKPAKDVAEFLTLLVVKHQNPDALLAELVTLLASFPPGKPFPAGKASSEALKAAHLVLLRKAKEAATGTKPAAAA